MSKYKVTVFHKSYANGYGETIYAIKARNGVEIAECKTLESALKIARALEPSPEQPIGKDNE